MPTGLQLDGSRGLWDESPSRLVAVNPNASPGQLIGELYSDSSGNRLVGESFI